MIINGIDYKTKKEAQEKARAILNGVKLNTKLSEPDFEFMMGWFEQVHEEPQVKFGCGVKSISVRMNYQHSKRGVRGFWLTRHDGTETDISYLPKRTQYAKVTAALRHAVKPTIEAFRQANNMLETEHVDHAGEWPFSRIVTEFERQIGAKIDTLKIKPHDDGDMVNELQDANIAARFKAFHDSVCQLQALDAKENLAKGNKVTFADVFFSPLTTPIITAVGTAGDYAGMTSKARRDDTEQATGYRLLIEGKRSWWPVELFEQYWSVVE